MNGTSERTGDGINGRATVVVVDDNEVNVMLVRKILALRPGLDVVCESDGRRGLDLVTRLQPDLVLLDLRLPGMGGEEVLREMRANADTSDIPVLVTSAESSERLKQRLRDAGAQGYLEKPVEISAFLDMVEDLLEHA
jgi:CheY-like chemotaxis protein